MDSDQDAVRGRGGAGRSLYRLTAEFSRLEQAAAIQRIRSLADRGFADRQIVALTGWHDVDVRRALSGRL
jgi:hypothetical protein